MLLYRKLCGMSLIASETVTYVTNIQAMLGGVQQPYESERRGSVKVNVPGKRDLIG